jgi:WD40 repeat protein
VAFSPDGRYVLTGDTTSARLWDVATGREIRRFQGHSEWINSVAFSPDGCFLLTGGGDSAAHLWETALGREVRRFEGHSGVISSVAFSADGRSALTGSRDRTARLWDLATGREIRRFKGHSNFLSSLAFSPDGRSMLTGSGDGTAKLWDVATGREIREFKGHSQQIQSVAISPDGRSALTGSSDGTAKLWDVASATEIRRFEGHSGWIDSVSFSPDGRSVLTGSEGTARLWDVATGAEIHRFEGHSGWINSVAFSPDGRSVLTGTTLWEVATGREIRRFDHFFSVNSVAFSPDGRYVLTGSGDGTTPLWDASTGRLLASLVSFREGGWAVVDPEGRYDASDPDNSPGLHFVAGNEVIELGQLKKRFYTPDLLARIWRGETFEPLANLNDVKLVPRVELMPPAKGSAQATVRLTNRQGGIGRLIVKVNGREVPTATRGSASYQPDAATAEVNLDLSAATLSPTGKNVIEVSAFNGENSIESRGLVHSWEYNPPQDPNPPRIFGIVVGVSEYYNPAMNLRYAAKDAVDIGHALRLAALGLYNDPSRVKITVLATGTSLEPTKGNVRKAFDEVGKESRAQDLLIVYFAGHGMASRSERDQYYYFTKEARSIEVDTDSALRDTTTVSSTELRQWLYRQNMPLKQVVVLDTCAAGAAFGEMVKLGDRRDLSPDQIRAIELLKDSTGSWILMGSAADAVSYEANRYAQGLLTYALLQGMKGAALDGDQVEVSRLFGFAQRQVADLARGIGGIQRPVLSAPKGQTFPIGLLSEEDRRQIHLATLKPQLLLARVEDDDQLDPLKLEPALRAELRAASMPVTRGGERGEAQVAYLDSVAGEVADALSPRVLYTIVGDKVKLRIRLLRNGKPVAEWNLELAKAEAAELSKVLVVKIVTESCRVK